MPKGFLTDEWPGLVDSIAKAFSFPATEREAFASCRVAALIGALPFLSSCTEPRRCALAHLGTYVLAARSASKDAFLHSPADDAFLGRRLEQIGDFLGGDRALIVRGMELLALVMVAGYQRDREADAAKGKYNPLNSKAWDYEKMRAEQALSVAAIPCPEMDAILDPSAATSTTWEW